MYGVEVSAETVLPTLGCGYTVLSRVCVAGFVCEARGYDVALVVVLICHANTYARTLQIQIDV